MKRAYTYKINGVLIALLILLASILPTAVSGKNGRHSSNQSDNLVEISVKFPGMERMQSYNLKITREKYREVQRIFNDTRLHPEIDKTGGNLFFLADGMR